MPNLSPTGLEPDDVAHLNSRRLRRLARWHNSVAGSDDGRPWWPAAIRRLPLEQRIELAEDAEYHQHWMRGEQLRVADDVAYFVEGYGSIRPERAGAVPIPFELWPLVEAAAELCVGARTQREVLELFVREQIVVVLKARQLGLTWLALHYALWMMGYNPELPRARVLALSKKEDDATDLLGRMRGISKLLPPYLRIPEDRETRGSLSRYKLQGRGSARSLVSNPDAPRSEQADVFLWDEAAFARNRSFDDTWQAALPTLGDHGKAILISTGNGPEETPGDGQGFAITFGKALAAEDGMVAVFLPDAVNPQRTDAWRERRARKFVSQASFEAEHPQTVDQALQGKQGDKVYPLAGIAAAAKLGIEFDERLREGDLPLPTGLSDGLIDPGLDWGVYTHLLTIWELEGGGIYVPPGAVASFNEEVSDKTLQYIRNVRELVQEPYSDGGLTPRLGQARFDAAGIEQMRTFIGLVQGGLPDAKTGEVFPVRPDVQRSWDMVRVQHPTVPRRIRTLAVPFNKYKAETMEYLTWLFNRSARAVQGGPRWGIIVISPTNKELLRQLRGLEYEDDGSGRIVKYDDHGPDALVAGGAPIAAANRARIGPQDDDADALREQRAA